MSLNLPRLNIRVAIVDAMGRPVNSMQRWWQTVAGSIEQAVNDILAAQAAAAAANANAETRQPGDDTLTAISALDDAVGLLEQTGADAFTKRGLGVADPASVPTTGDADGRYVMQDVGDAWAAATGTASRATFATYAAPVVTDPPTQAEVQDVANAVQVLSERVKALIDDLQGNGALT